MFGMNLGGIPFADNTHGFFLIVMLLLTLTTILAFLARNIFNKKD